MTAAGQQPIEERHSPRTLAAGEPPPLVTVAICTRNRAPCLEKAVRSVLEQIHDDTEILIVDNASTDETPRVTAALAAANRCVTVRRELSPGIIFARNAALASARGHFVLFLDDDEVAEPGWLAAYAEFLTHAPSAQVACVGGPYIAQYESPPPAWISPSYGSYDVGGGQRALTGKTSLAGGNCAYRKEIAQQAGGFAAGLMRYEDSELNGRLRAMGYEVWWLPTARVRHLISPDRFRIKAQISLAIAEGRSVAFLRLVTMGRRSGRILLWFGRLVAAPVQILLQWAAAAFLMLARRPRLSMDLFLRGFRAAGLAWQLLKDTRHIFWGKWSRGSAAFSGWAR